MNSYLIGFHARFQCASRRTIHGFLSREKPKFELFVAEIFLGELVNQLKSSPAPADHPGMPPAAAVSSAGERGTEKKDTLLYNQMKASRDIHKPSAR
jgi:hypothetical protein